MNTKTFFGILTIVLLLVACGTSGKKGETVNDSTASLNEVTTSGDASVMAAKKYQIKSAIVTFESNGMGVKQKIVLYFDDYGAKEAEEKYDGDQIKESSLCDGTTRYTLIYKDKIAYSQGDCYRGVAYKFDWNEISKAGKEYKAKQLPNVTVAGKDCESFSIVSGKNTVKYAGWSNVCLLIDQDSQFGKILYTAISIEENTTIPTDKLSVPAGFEVKKSSM